MSAVPVTGLLRPVGRHDLRPPCGRKRKMVPQRGAEIRALPNRLRFWETPNHDACRNFALALQDGAIPSAESTPVAQAAAIHPFSAVDGPSWPHGAERSPSVTCAWLGGWGIARRYRRTALSPFLSNNPEEQIRLHQDLMSSVPGRKWTDGPLARS